MTLSLYAVTFDCTDAMRLAEFWGIALDRKVDDHATKDFASIGLGDNTGQRPGWMFVSVPEAKQVKNRVHVDLISATKAGDVQRLLAIGATYIAGFDEDGSQWTTLTDPEGNEFDIVAGDAES
jgi:hypothetical protein